MLYLINPLRLAYSVIVTSELHSLGIGIVLCIFFCKMLFRLLQSIDEIFFISVTLSLLIQYVRSKYNKKIMFLCIILFSESHVTKLPSIL